MSDSTNICLSCGLCCDGSLIGHVQLGKDEISDTRITMEIEEENGNGFFLQPCQKYCDGCTVYSKRPQQCRSFDCGLLKSVKQLDVEFDTALEIINIVKQKKSTIEKKLVTLPEEFRSKSFYFKMVELKKILESNISNASHNEAEKTLESELKELNHIVIKEFDVALN